MKLSILLVCFLLTAFVTSSAAEVEQVQIYKILLDDKYYGTDDPKGAASRMRADSREFGADIHQIPQFPLRDRFSGVGQGSVSISMTNVTKMIRVFPSDKSFEQRLHTKSGDSRVAILLVNRGLTIDETAKILENGLQIYSRIPSGLVVGGDSKSLASLTKEVYFFWIGDYLAEYKEGSNYFESSLNMYNLECFGDVTDAFLEDLSRLGVSVRKVRRRNNAISITGAWAEVQKCRDLWWVELVSARVQDVPDGLMLGSDDKLEVVPILRTGQRPF